MPGKISIAAVTALAALAVTAGPAAADTAPTMTLHYTGQPQSVTVPPGVVGVQLSLTGGAGGKQGKSAGGHAASVAGYAPVSEGDTLTVDVGGAGGNSDNEAAGPGRGGFGYTTGGAGSKSENSYGGAGGGGSSAVLDGATVLAVAGGGGGSGAAGSFPNSHGAGGGDAGAMAGAGKSSDTAKGGLGGVTAGGTGGTGATCGGNSDGAGGGGGGGGALVPGGGAAGNCGQDTITDGTIAYAGAGGGSGASAAPMTGATVRTAASSGDGSVTLNWVAPPACHDSTVVVDSAATAQQSIDLSKLCTGVSPISTYTLVGEEGVGHMGALDAASGHGSITVEPGQAGVGVATVKFANAVGSMTARLTILVAPGGKTVLSSRGLALDGGSQEIDNPAVGEPVTGGGSQRWTIHPDGEGDGAFVVADGRDDACLTTRDLGSAPGTSLVLATCGSDIPSRFRITADASGDGVTMTDVDSGLPIGFTSADPGALLALGNAADTPTWTLSAAASTK